MTLLKNPSCWLSVCLIFALSRCATAPQSLTGICPPFPQAPVQLLKPLPTLYLLPPEMRQD